jgi:hypothetical protein
MRTRKGMRVAEGISYLTFGFKVCVLCLGWACLHVKYKLTGTHHRMDG